MTDKEIIKGILSCTVNVNDVNKHISVDGYNLMTIFKLLYKASCEYIYSKTKQRSIYKLSNRWFEYEDGSTVWLQDDKTFIDETYINILDCMRLIVDKIEATPELQQEQEETQSSKPQQEQSNTTKRKGKFKREFKDLLIDDEDGKKLERIHKVLDGSKGKDIPLIILACMKKTWLSRLPTFTQVRDEFGDIGSKSNFNNYLNETKFKKIEIETVIDRLDLD